MKQYLTNLTDGNIWILITVSSRFILQKYNKVQNDCILVNRAKITKYAMFNLEACIWITPC